ncbi:hypothetical protein [Streptomyces cacaoi]|uniref:Lipoprotein n=1 Tax=Streptomyces cacaoi TaxID=1898 RepID=A0A4Y3R916_STRCI|nr:hypothetical protein [Streptomyces cacaoi]NNG84560.1 hypothetical protein [Streptomyces cacaoi]GEB54064.1 lipoprotein [Streptomyces cacaoi]
MNDRTTSARTRIRLRGTAAVCAVTGALLLGACGSDDSGDKSGEIKGADKGGTSPTASASGSPGDDIERPDIKLGKDAENVFEKTETGDPTKARVLADNQRRIDSIDQVITRRVGLKTMNFYAKGQVLRNETEYAKNYVEQNVTWVGKTHYYNQSVTLDGKNKATVTFCIDESDSTTKHLKTGKLDPKQKSEKSFTFNTVEMERNKNGVWQGTEGSSTLGGQKCAR